MDHDIEDEADDLTTCPDCGSTDIKTETELMRPWFTEYHCQNCGNCQRGLS